MPRLHIVTNDDVLARPDFTTIAADLLRALGTDAALHIRGPRSTGARVYEAARSIAEDVGTASLVVNDRVDVALAVGARVHLGQRSLSVQAARRILPTGTLIGRSIRQGVREGVGADYLFCGPVFDTVSHPELTGRGPDWLREITEETDQEVIGIGGISPERTGVLLEAGAFGVAAIRCIWDAPNPVRVAETLRNLLHRKS